MTKPTRVVFQFDLADKELTSDTSSVINDSLWASWWEDIRKKAAEHQDDDSHVISISVFNISDPAPLARILTLARAYHVDYVHVKLTSKGGAYEPGD